MSEDSDSEFEVEEYSGGRINGKNIALRRYEFLNKEVLDYEDYIWAMGFMSDIKLKEGLPDNTPNNWTSYAIEFSDKFVHASISEIEEFFRDPIITQEFKADFNKSFSKIFPKLSPETKESFLSWRKPDFMDYDYLSPQFWTQTFEEGQSGLMLGSKGSGKTDFALLLAENYINSSVKIVKGERVEEKRSIASNISIPKEDVETEIQKNYVSRFKYYSKFSELMLIVVDNAINNIKTMNIGDEMTVGGFRKKRAMAGASLNMDEYERLTRKLGTSNLYIWHLDTEVPSEINGMVSFTGRKHGSTINKSARRLGTFTFKRDKKSVMYHIKNIPRTVIPFKTRDIAPFNIDIPLKTMIEKLSDQETEGQDDIDLFKDLKREILRLQKSKKEEEE